MSAFMCMVCAYYILYTQLIHIHKVSFMYINTDVKELLSS